MILELEILKNTPEFSALTKAQKLCVATYVEARNTPGMTDQARRLLAVRTAYKCKNDLVATVMTYRVFDHPKVKATVGRHEGKDEKTVFMEELLGVIRAPSLNIPKLNAMKLYAKMKGWVLEAEETLKSKASEKRKRIRKGVKEAKARQAEAEEGSTYDLSEFEKIELSGLNIEAADDPRD